MAHDLEKPRSDDELYRARGADELAGHRPILTGDVFARVPFILPDGQSKLRDLMVLQHPCSLRTNGVDLVPNLLVASVGDFKRLEDWRTHGSIMPLPSIRPDATNAKKRHQSARFGDLHLVSSEQLTGKRIACLSLPGVNLVLQRWVYYSSRVTVPTHDFNSVNISVFEEADIIEEWCEDRQGDGISVEQATRECVEWLREEKGDAPMRQDLLKSDQHRSSIRREASKYRRSLRDLSKNV